MSYTPLTEPFTISFINDGAIHNASVVYAKADDNCSNFFSVTIREPSDIEPIQLKEKPILTPEFEYMVWVDQNDKPTSLYQQIGKEIEKQLKEQMGIILMDVSATQDEQENK